MMEPAMFDLLYGDAARSAIAERAQLVAEQPVAGEGGALSALADTEIIFTGWSGPRFDAELLHKLPRLRAVFHAGGTVKPHVTDAFWDRGIAITTAASANATPVAQYTLGAILLSLKGAWRLGRETRRQRTFGWQPRCAIGIRGATVGLISLGLIGRQVAQLLRDFHIAVLVYDPYLSPAVLAECGAIAVTLPELLTASDVVSLHTPLTRETAGMITGDLLRRMRPNATLINTARGGLIDERELISFLRERPDVQAILDVTSPEPPAPASPLYDLENVFLTPHIAGSVGTECLRLGAVMVEELDRYLRGLRLLHAVSREEAARQT